MFLERKRVERTTLFYLGIGLLGGLLGGLIISIGLFYLLQSQFPKITGSTNVHSTSIGVKQLSFDVQTDITKIVAENTQVVVSVMNIKEGNSWLTSTEKVGTGSGVIYKIENDLAYIVTNHHVVEGFNRLEVKLSDGTTLQAKLVGSDIWTDLAVISVPAGTIRKVANFGNSDLLKPGEPVLAIGSPLGLIFSGSVTQGIISGLERTIPVDLNDDGYPDWQAEVLQTDAAINPGNSGGALLNSAGQVIGINSMKIAKQTVEGIGLAIPINSVVPVLQQIEQYGKVKRGYIGVNIRSLEDIPIYYKSETLQLPENINEGIVIQNVVDGSPAANSGLKTYDVITQLDQIAVKNVVEFRKYLYQNKKIGDSIQITFYRGSKMNIVTLTLVSSD